MVYREYFRNYKGSLSTGESVVSRFHWKLNNDQNIRFCDILLHSRDKYFFSCHKCGHSFRMSIYDVVVNYRWCGCVHGKCIICNRVKQKSLLNTHRQMRENEAKKEAKLKNEAEKEAMKFKVEQIEQSLIAKVEKMQNDEQNKAATATLFDNLSTSTVEVEKSTKCLSIQSTHFNLSCNACKRSDIRDVHGCTNFSCTSCSHTMTNNGVFFHMRCQFCPTSCWFPASGFSNPDNYQCPCTKSSS